MDGTRLATSLWERVYREYNDACLLPDRAEAHRRREEAERSAHRLIGRAYREEHWWMYQALRDADRKLFAVRAFAGTVPRRFFTAALRAAVQETDYARTDAFVLPCVFSYGARRVTEELLHYLSSGTAPQRAGAAVALVSTAKAALDWHSYCYTGQVSERGTYNPSAEAAERYAGWRELRELRNRLLVDVFRTNEDMMVRRRIASLLYSDPEVPHDLRTALGPAGLAIARRDDMSIAQRRALLVIAMAEIGYRPTLFPLHKTLLSSPKQLAYVQRLLSIAVR